MKLKPLKQFICDSCGQVINEPEHGDIIWKYSYNDSGRKSYDFKLVHHITYSPFAANGKSGRCDPDEYPASMSLKQFFGTDESDIMIHLLGFLDDGIAIRKEFKEPGVVSIREYVELVRRLTLPNYEEARIYWNDAISNSDFAGLNEFIIYTPDFLEKIINKYKN